MRSWNMTHVCSAVYFDVLVGNARLLRGAMQALRPWLDGARWRYLGEPPPELHVGRGESRRCQAEGYPLLCMGFGRLSLLPVMVFGRAVLWCVVGGGRVGYGMAMGSGCRAGRA